MLQSSVATRTHLTRLDGLRGIAVLSVLAYHVGMFSVLARVGGAEQLIWGLKAGVTVFFVLSGFLLYLPYARAIHRAEPGPSWRRYAVRRAARILPAYWLALTIVGLLSASSGVLGSGWWRYYGLVQIYDQRTLLGGLGVSWSLCVEVSFYLSLPVIAWFMSRLARRASPGARVRIQLAVAGALALLAVAFRLVLSGSFTGQPLDHQVLLTSLPAQLDWFAIGIVFAVVTSVWEVDGDRFRALRWLGNRPGGCWVLAVAVYLLVMIAQPVDRFLTQYGLLAHLGLGVFAGLIVLPAISCSAVRPKALTMRFLSTRAVVWIGTISYGVYLWQVRVRMTLFPSERQLSVPATAGLLALTLAITVGLAAASWYLLELRVQRLSRSRTRSRQRGPRADSSSAEIAATIVHQPV
jgi:peptidoglycan/LPS O-acetylase OafA/YrhL